MTLQEDQIPQIKKQLIGQIDSTFPDDKKAQAIEQINSMNSEQLEQFLIQNNLVKSGEAGSPSEQQCVFCSIAEGKIPSAQIGENKKALAVLELNPISKGHTLILPKEHLETADKLPSQVLALAKKIAKKIKSVLKPKDILIETANLFGHSLINVLPIYENENLASPRTKAEPAELDELAKTLRPKPKAPRKPRIKKIKENSDIRLPRRIP